MIVKDNLGHIVSKGDYITMIGSAGLYDIPFFEYFKVLSIDEHNLDTYLCIKYINGDKSYKICYDGNNPGFIRIQLTDEFIMLNCIKTEELEPVNKELPDKPREVSIWRHT